jgi:two-component system nitrate/nitrite response regulator NarL
VIRVVVADDEPDVRLLLRVQLERQGFDVVGEAVDGREAIERCADTEPDALVLDLLMPGVNGFEAITALRHDRPKMAIIAYTAVAGDFVRKEMARLHIPLLLKSGDVTALANKLNELAGVMS